MVIVVTADNVWKLKNVYFMTNDILNKMDRFCGYVFI